MDGEAPTTRHKGERMKKTGLLIASIFLFTVLLNNSPAFSKTKKKKSAKKPAKRPEAAVFDMSHSEMFSPAGEGPLDYSVFMKLFKTTGPAVEFNRERITARSLERAGTYVLAGPEETIAPDEIEALKHFVKGGGNLLVLMQTSSPVARLTEAFGVIVSRVVIAEQSDTINGQAQDFYVTRFAPHEVTEGLKKISLYESWGLMPRAEARIVAASSEKAFADNNRNRQLDKDEPVLQFGIIGVCPFGNGKVVVLSDDAPITNQHIGEADNQKLAENIIKWFKGASKN